jgi:hypothetical protein
VYYFDADTGENLLRQEDDIPDAERKTGDGNREPEITPTGASTSTD